MPSKLHISQEMADAKPEEAKGRRDEQAYEKAKKGLVRLKKTLKDNAEEDLVVAFKDGVACVNGHRKKMGFTFDHDDVRKKSCMILYSFLLRS